MSWIFLSEQKPLTYLTGNWDGKNSDTIVFEDIYGKLYLGHFCEGFMDGSKFENWYDSNSYLVEEEIVRYLKIPV